MCSLDREQPGANVAECEPDRFEQPSRVIARTFVEGETWDCEPQFVKNLASRAHATRPRR